MACGSSFSSYGTRKLLQQLWRVEAALAAMACGSSFSSYGTRELRQRAFFDHLVKLKSNWSNMPALLLLQRALAATARCRALWLLPTGSALPRALVATARCPAVWLLLPGTLAATARFDCYSALPRAAACYGCCRLGKQLWGADVTNSLTIWSK
jgi:hypothetical protein